MTSVSRWTATIIAWGDRHGFAVALLVRVGLPIVVGVALGMGLDALVGALPAPWGAVLVVAVCLAAFVWCVRSLIWVRRVERRARERLEEFDRDTPAGHPGHGGHAEERP